MEADATEVCFFNEFCLGARETCGDDLVARLSAGDGGGEVGGEIAAGDFADGALDCVGVACACDDVRVDKNGVDGGVHDERCRDAAIEREDLATVSGDCEAFNVFGMGHEDVVVVVEDLQLKEAYCDDCDAQKQEAGD